jgi:hypothetical protein
LGSYFFAYSVFRIVFRIPYSRYEIRKIYRNTAVSCHPGLWVCRWMHASCRSSTWLCAARSHRRAGRAAWSMPSAEPGLYNRIVVSHPQLLSSLHAPEATGTKHRPSARRLSSTGRNSRSDRLRRFSQTAFHSHFKSDKSLARRGAA